MRNLENIDIEVRKLKTIEREGEKKAMLLENIFFLILLFIL